MSSPVPMSADAPHPPTVFFLCEGVVQQRSVSDLLLHDTLVIPVPPQRLLADWAREVDALGLTPGEIEPLSLARTIMRWSDYPHCRAAVLAWLVAQGLPDLLDPDELALMACLGTPYHHDAELYGDRIFCNLFLTEDKGMDLHFPALGQRIPLQRGTVVIFDTAQPHAVIPRASERFDVADFVRGQDCMQVFLTWELPVENPPLQRALQIDSSASTSPHCGVRVGGVPMVVCPGTGHWLPAEAA